MGGPFLAHLRVRSVAARPSDRSPHRGFATFARSRGFSQWSALARSFTSVGNVAAH